jgi:hypothetical protein
MGKLIPNAFNLAVVIYVALGSTACSYGMAIIGYVGEYSPNDGEANHYQFNRWSA